MRCSCKRNRKIILRYLRPQDWPEKFTLQLWILLLKIMVLQTGTSSRRSLPTISCWLTSLKVWSQCYNAWALGYHHLVRLLQTVHLVELTVLCEGTSCQRANCENGGCSHSIVPVEDGYRGFSVSLPMSFLSNIGLSTKPKRSTTKSLQEEAEAAFNWIWHHYSVLRAT